MIKRFIRFLFSDIIYGTGLYLSSYLLRFEAAYTFRKHAFDVFWLDKQIGYQVLLSRRSSTWFLTNFFFFFVKFIILGVCTVVIGYVYFDYMIPNGYGYSPEFDNKMAGSYYEINDNIKGTPFNPPLRLVLADLKHYVQLTGCFGGWDPGSIIWDGDGEHTGDFLFDYDNGDENYSDGLPNLLTLLQRSSETEGIYFGRMFRQVIYDCVFDIDDIEDDFAPADPLVIDWLLYGAKDYEFDAYAQEQGGEDPKEDMKYQTINRKTFHPKYKHGVVGEVFYDMCMVENWTGGGEMTPAYYNWYSIPFFAIAFIDTFIDGYYEEFVNLEDNQEEDFDDEEEGEEEQMTTLEHNLFFEDTECPVRDGEPNGIAYDHREGDNSGENDDEVENAALWEHDQVCYAYDPYVEDGSRLDQYDEFFLSLYTNKKYLSSYKVYSDELESHKISLADYFVHHYIPKRNKRIGRFLMGYEKIEKILPGTKAHDKAPIQDYRAYLRLQDGSRGFYDPTNKKLLSCSGFENFSFFQKNGSLPAGVPYYDVFNPCMSQERSPISPIFTPTMVQKIGYDFDDFSRFDFDETITEVEASANSDLETITLDWFYDAFDIQVARDKDYPLRAPGYVVYNEMCRRSKRFYNKYRTYMRKRRNGHKTFAAEFPQYPEELVITRRTRFDFLDMTAKQFAYLYPYFDPALRSQGAPVGSEGMMGHDLKDRYFSLSRAEFEKKLNAHRKESLALAMEREAGIQSRGDEGAVRGQQERKPLTQDQIDGLDYVKDGQTRRDSVLGTTRDIDTYGEELDELDREMEEARGRYMAKLRGEIYLEKDVIYLPAFEEKGEDKKE